MNTRAAAITATAAFALAVLGAGPAFADNHISVAPQGQDGAFEHLNPQHMTDGAYEHLSPQTLVVGGLATN
ncbi:hypothetical protein [Streptomyces sp. NBC_01244]|uniref:hypothetical protein n=1 Tax=Streptomyces sp. NBC_01244 TaxID=2903797 RepID=UPI002E1065D8|nr:hypothetical protein OG247_35030 [Streptomyces sp. NBC_01244]